MKNDLTTAYQNGATLRDLAQQTGLSTRQVRKNITTPLRPRGRQTTTPHDLTTAYQNGATLRDLAQQTGLSPAGVRLALIRAGVKLRPKTRRPASTKASGTSTS